jgi:hypothetical protein
VNVNALGAKTIIKSGGAALAAGDLTTTAVAQAIYDGTNFELQNPQTSSGSSAVSSVFGRTGAVAATSGDYGCSLVTGCQPSLTHFTMSPACGGVANCVPIVDDNATNNCGTPLTNWLAAINSYAGPGIPSVDISGGQNASSAIKFTSCVIALTQSVHWDGHGSWFNCGQSGINCVQIGPTGLSGFSIPGTAGATYLGPSVFTEFRNTNFIGGAGVSGAGIYIEPYQDWVVLDNNWGTSFGAGNSTPGSCTNYFEESDSLNNGVISNNTWVSWDSTVGRCGFKNTNVLAGDGLATINFDNNWISAFGVGACGSVGVYNNMSYSTYTNNTVVGFNDLYILDGTGVEGGGKLSDRFLDTNSCPSTADVLFTGSGNIDNWVFEGSQVRGTSFLGTSTSFSGAVKNIDVAHNLGPFEATLIFSSTHPPACATGCTVEYNPNTTLTLPSGWATPLLIAAGSGISLNTTGGVTTISTGSGPLWTQTNYQSGTGGGTGTGSTAAFSTALTNPSTIVVYAGTTTSIAGCTDTAGNTFVDSGQGTIGFDSSAVLFKVLVAFNTHATASDVVTCTGVGVRGIYAAEYTNTSGVSSIDVSSSVANQTTTGGANALACPSMTTTVNGELVVGAFGTFTNNITAGTSPNAFTLAGSGSTLEYFIQSAAGAIAPTAGDSGSDTWGAICIGLKP